MEGSEFYISRKWHIPAGWPLDTGFTSLSMGELWVWLRPCFPVHLNRKKNTCIITVILEEPGKQTGTETAAGRYSWCSDVLRQFPSKHPLHELDILFPEYPPSNPPLLSWPPPSSLHLSLSLWNKYPGMFPYSNPGKRDTNTKFFVHYTYAMKL